MVIFQGKLLLTSSAGGKGHDCLSKFPWMVPRMEHTTISKSGLPVNLSFTHAEEMTIFFM